MSTTKNTLQQLHDQGQSPWLDYIARDLLTSGQLESLIQKGIMGLTSNPTIFQKAIADSTAYDDDLRQLVRQGESGKNTDALYDGLVLADIRTAATILRPVYDQTRGRDGYVSIEEPPSMAYQTEPALAEVHRLFNYLNLPNIMVKIPGTPEGIAAFQQAIAEGFNINVTLVFSVQNYRHVAEAYIAGLEKRAAAGKPIDTIASVASFFVSRVDTAVDKRLDELIAAADSENHKQDLRALQGKAAIANARLAYAAYKEIFDGPRWQTLAQHGARVQRCLWASTSAKNPAYRDILYAEQLIGPDTVDTMPPVTIDAFLDHAHVASTLDQDIDQARTTFAALERVGISMDEVTLKLQQDGVRQFAESYDSLINGLRAKREDLLAHTH